MFWILNEENQVVETDGEGWMEWYKTHDRRVAETPLPNKVYVSTVFIGLYGQIFETMVFGNGNDTRTKRTRTWDEAVKAHNDTVTKLQEESDAKP